MSDNETVIQQINASFQKHTSRIKSLRTESVKKRIEYLTTLRQWIHSNRKIIHEAMYSDFRKPAAEVDAIEIFHVLNEIKLAIDNIHSWTRPKKVDAPITMLGTRSFIQYEPRGVCLIISPWNYPFSLCIGPLVSALAAGNSLFIKPSELTPHVSGLINKMCKEIFPDQNIEVFEGGPDVSQHLLTLPFDHIFFTGSPAIGKIIMKAAAENLTSITLELGGKSPAIVTSTTHMKDAAQRIAVAKFVNNGQTCVAPDYVLIDEKIASTYINELIIQTKKLFTENNQSFIESKSYARIVNEKHFNRLTSLLEDAINKGAKIELGGDMDSASKFFHPVILSNVSRDSKILEEEIFGPILPIITYQTLEEAIVFVNSKPKALALYIFAHHKPTTEKVLRETSSGGVCVNECAIHFLHHNLPFGGVNNSGIGKSHGHYGFLAFSNEKPVMKQRRGFTSVKAFYPPYTPFKQKLMNIFLKMF